jgi:hypothetical protein
MGIGIDSFVSTVTGPGTGVDVSPAERAEHLLEEIERDEQVGLDTGIGEHHRHGLRTSGIRSPAATSTIPGMRTNPFALSTKIASEFEGG